MSLFYHLKRLYSLDTLDTRFTVSSKTPLDRTAAEHGVTESIEARTGAQTRNVLPGTQPSKWSTKEYYFYYFIFITIVPLMFWIPFSVSRESDPEYPRFAPLLSPGWILGRKVDNSDAQYASFRDNIPYMAIVVVVHPLLRKLYNSVRPLKASDNTKSASFADARQSQRIAYDFFFAIVFTFVLHGFSAFKVFLIIYTNYQLAVFLPRKYVPAATWIFNIGVLFTNELFHGYPYARIAEQLALPFVISQQGDRNWGAWLDRYSGLIARWDVLFNITVLRLISFNLDYYWSLDYRAGSPVEKKQIDPASISERDRVSTPPSPSAYTLYNYFAYILYSPLYLAGPILTFNDYISQCRYRSPSITRTRTALYAVRFLITLLSMELILHFIYAVAISKSNPNWSHYTPFQLSMLGYHNLHIIWLKLLLPWRFFRLWALLDGIDPPENMVRCMSNNYSTLAFWRGWHRSFNRWIVRYIYVPLQQYQGSGGRSKIRGVVNMTAAFTFVALWHDISLRLLTWSWLIILFILPELLCSTVFFPARKYADRPDTYRYICGVGAVVNVLMMMAANLVGFAVGLDGLEGLVAGIVSGWLGWSFLVAACATLFVGVMVMFEIREEERRKGIVMKC